MSIPWVEKYRPKKVSDVIGNKEAIETFLEWMRSWESGKPQKKAALLYGPAGVGKTSLVIAYATENRYDLVEVNASDWRNAERIKAVVGSASQSSTIDGVTKRIILVDEVDGIAGKEDAGGIVALRDVIDKARVPIVLIANDPWDQKLSPIRDRCLMIQFKRIDKRLVVAHLKKICSMEGIECDESILKAIADRSEGDLRSAINDLQALAGGGKRIDSSMLGALGFRMRVKEIFEALVQIFQSKTIKDASKATEGLDMDIEELFTWILDNAPTQLTDPSDLEMAMDYLAKADLYLARIKKKQMWGLLRYASPTMTGGIAVSRRNPPKGFVKFSYPSKIKMLHSLKEERELISSICIKIASRCHMSSYKSCMEFLPYLKFMLANDGSKVKGLVKYFGFTSDEVSFLSKKGSHS